MIGVKHRYKFHREQYVSPRQAGIILGLQRKTVMRWIFRFWLPATKLPNGHWKIKLSDLERHDPPPKKKVLIIDDDRKKIASLAGTVRSLGHEAIIAYNKQDAELKPSEDVFSLIILNVTMTKINAWKLLPHLRRQRILIVSDRDLSVSEMDRLLEVRALGFLQRPFRSTSLLPREIEQLLPPPRDNTPKHWPKTKVKKRWRTRRRHWQYEKDENRPMEIEKVHWHYNLSIDLPPARNRP